LPIRLQLTIRKSGWVGEVDLSISVRLCWFSRLEVI